jgi:hypothetical protein
MMRCLAATVLLVSCTSTEAQPETVVPANTSLSIVHINTRGERVDPDGEFDKPWFDVDLSLISATDGTASVEDLPDLTTNAAIRLRGNSSLQYAKKQFALETRDAANEDVDIAPFGLPAEEDWILHAPYSDKSLMRNHLMFGWSRAIGRYAPRTVFVELYLQDGATSQADDYRGVYLWVEKIKRDDERVNIDKLDENDDSLPEISGGYLLRRDWVEPEDAAFVTARYGDALRIESPKQEDLTDVQHDYLLGYLNDFEDALALGDGSYTTFIDVDSFVDHLLMMELSRNVDAYVLSTYMHKPRDGKLFMGPVWDFNGSLGNADYFDAWQVEGWHYNNPEFPADNPNGFRWYEKLLEDTAFQGRISERWAEHRAGAWSDTQLLADIDDGRY